MAENFFSILKTEFIYRHKPPSFRDTNDIIERYILFYNRNQIQFKTGVPPLSGGFLFRFVQLPKGINHNHPSNGWFAQRLKAFITGQRLKALAFTMFKPIAFATFAAP